MDKAVQKFPPQFPALAKVCEYHWDSVPEGLDQLARDPKHRQKLSYWSGGKCSDAVVERSKTKAIYRFADSDISSDQSESYSPTRPRKPSVAKVATDEPKEPKFCEANEPKGQGKRTVVSPKPKSSLLSISALFLGI